MKFRMTKIELVSFFTRQIAKQDVCCAGVHCAAAFDRLAAQLLDEEQVPA